MAYSLGEYQDIFLEEADEQLQELNQNLLHLEKVPDDVEVINNIFRAAHSLKSSAAFVGLNDLSDLAHNMENLLQGIRDKTLQAAPQVIEVLFNCFDVISGVIDEVASGKKPEADLASIIQRIKRVSGGAQAPATDVRPARRIEPHDHEPRTALSAAQVKMIRDGLKSGQSCCEISIFIEPSAQMKWIKAQLVLKNLAATGRVVTSMPPEDSLTEEKVKDVIRVILLTDRTADEVRRACEVDLVTRVDLKKISISRRDDKVVLKFHERETLFEDQERGSPYDVVEVGTGAVHERAGVDEEEDEDQYKLETLRKKDDKRAPTLKIVKVSVDKLDQLLNNVGELVIANSGFYRLYEEIRKSNVEKGVANEFKSRMDQMSRIAKDLQAGIMKTRMVPIGQVFSRFNRLVRDLAKEFGKSVRLEIKGEETELDKKVIDVIGEPLIHLIRNAIDHGIEPPEERRRLQKSEMATLILNAYQAGNQIFVHVSDDGRGLNAARIRRTAMEKGLAPQDLIASMDDSEVYNFIYDPGFSTSETVTDISGRGVGLNIVKEAVSELNGSVNIETEPGMGTQFIMAFPLTLAIIPAIMVRVNRELYAVPLSDVIETIKISQADVTTIEGHEVINLRGELLSLIRLNEFVGTESGLAASKKTPVVVVGFGSRKVGLIVDILEGKQEIVIKSLEQNYTTVEGLAGASILGDGSICLILDIASMVNKVIAEQDRSLRAQRARAIRAREAGFSGIGQKGEVLRPGFGVGAESKPVAGAGMAVKAGDPGAGIKEDIVFERDEMRPSPPPVTARETPAAEMPQDRADAVEERVRSALQTFREELQDTIQTSVEHGAHDDHIKKHLRITEEDIKKVRVLANVGITNAAESLSKILDKRIDLSIPKVTLLPVEKIPESVGKIDNIYIGVYMPLVGDIKGTILFSLLEDSGFELINRLYGLESGETRELNEDGESALKEVTNIIGSSVINVFSDKTGIFIKPTVPTIVHDYMQSILDSILVMHNISNDYALIMDTEFYYENDTVIGELLVMPETDSLRKIVDMLK